MFLLCINPFVDLIDMLCDSRRISKTCLCADDVGAALQQLQDLRILFQIFRLCARISRMELKPSKCFLVITCITLSDEVKSAVKAWLANHIPEWVDFHIVSTGKYLGAWLGIEGEQKTWEEPAKKFQKRTIEISEGKAPSLPTIIRYNERCVPVFSYISQISLPPLPVQFPRLSRPVFRGSSTFRGIVWEGS